MFDRLKNTLWIDCDGVLADFDKSAFKIFGLPAREYEDKNGSDKMWARLALEDHFYYNLELMSEAIKLYYEIKHLYPVILTGSPSQLGEGARVDKFYWVQKHFGESARVVVCQAKHKPLYCKPGDVIIDDWPKHKTKWEEAGGIWVDHKDYNTTHSRLVELGVL